MENINKKILSISKIETINKKVDGALIGFNLFENVNGKEVKYALWLAKQDGESTKAYTQYKAQGVSVGTQIGIAYKEEPNQYEYTDKKTGEKKTAKSTNRTIVWFSDPSDMEEYDERFKNLQIPPEHGEEEHEMIEDEEIKIENIPF